MPRRRIKLYYVDCNQIKDDYSYELITKGIICEDNKILNIKNDLRRKMRYTGRLLLAYDLLERGFKKNIFIGRNKFGKPFLQNYESINFSVSYSNGKVVCAVADYLIGVDIEAKVKRGKYCEDFFAKSELAMLSKQHNFYEIFTKKEAYSKLIGKGFFEKFSTFSVIDLEISKKVFFNTILFEDVVSVCSYVKQADKMGTCFVRIHHSIDLEKDVIRRFYNADFSKY